jgi:hypothetical protein
MDRPTLTEGHQLPADHVNVYLRTHQKKALIVSVPRTLSFKDIKAIVRAKIPMQDQTMVLFHKGQRMTDDKTVEFNDKNIIHVIDEINVNKSQINIFVKLLDGSRK